MRHYRYNRFKAHAVGQNGGVSSRRGLTKASTELHYGEIEAAFTTSGYLRKDGVPCVRVSLWDDRYRRDGREVVFYDGPADFFTPGGPVAALHWQAVVHHGAGDSHA